MPAPRDFDVGPWRKYLAAFDVLLEARKHHDAAGARFARRVMLRELYARPLPERSVKGNRAGRFRF